MIETQNSTNLLVSKARATGAAGGVNIGTGSALENEGEIVQRGRYAAAIQLWNGQNEATGQLNKAAGLDYSGLVDVIGGRMAQQGADLSAGGQLMTTIAGGEARPTKCTTSRRPPRRQVTIPTICPEFIDDGTLLARSDRMA